jgi:DNA repair photolyase
LPGAVAQVFEERLRANLPLRAERVLHQIRVARKGQLNSAAFGERMRGSGVHWEMTRQLFNKSCERLGLNDREMFVADKESTFRRPPRAGDQLSFL